MQLVCLYFHGNSSSSSQNIKSSLLCFYNYMNILLNKKYNFPE